ncbi:hypothetical protein [Pseudoxanthomonas koreensis]|uniref:hypothetical protein n=1 Tax=Pseudoxanthomonas koreensis TaxID=266061 RepID=UPI0013911793|nr:hypothetical protein [Pseudoxanthomonas koreensis]KAF1691280.1 hypothetical protein CSC64_09755 [Pseudoxanthomonas koreensis]
MSRHLIACLPVLLLAAPVAHAAEAYAGVHPKKGEMVLLRDVSARPAYRPAPPGIALIVDPKPNREVHGTLGTGEMSDDEFAELSSGQLQVAAADRTSMPTQLTDRAVQGSLGRTTGPDGVLSGSGFISTVGGATGSVTGATRGIAPTVTGALSHFPLGAGVTPGKGP